MTAAPFAADPTTRKFQQGSLLLSVGELLTEIEQGHWVFWRHKPLHPGWLFSMTLRTLSGAIRAKILFKTEIGKGGHDGPQS